MPEILACKDCIVNNQYKNGIKRAFELNKLNKINKKDWYFNKHFFKLNQQLLQIF